MSIEAMTWALSSDVGDATRKLVLIGRANHAHKDGRNSYVGKGTLAEYVNCSEKTIRRHTIALEADGWIRLGDQSIVDHIRRDRRPVVYDLAMNEATRLAWKAEHAARERGDNLTPRPADTTGQIDPSSHDHGGTHGGSPVSERGDKAVTPEPSGTSEEPPTPSQPATGPLPLRCQRHPDGPGINCRACGTTTRQLEARQKQVLDQLRRDADRQAAKADRDRSLRAVPLPPDLKAQTREAIRSNQQRRTS